MKINKLYSRLIMAIVLLVIEIGLIIIGMMILKKYVSRVYVLNQSIINIGNEIENSLNTKYLVNKNKNQLEELEKFTIRKEEDIHFIAETIEDYADLLGLVVNINNIELTDGTIVKSKAPSQADIDKSKTAAEKTSPTDTKNNLVKPDVVIKSKPIYVTITSRGDFEKLVGLLKMLENSKYIIQISSYSIKQMLLLPPNLPGGEVIVKEIGTDPLKSSDVTTWVLNTKLIIYTHIQ